MASETRIPDDLRAQIVEACRTERPTREIAAQFGVSESSVRRFAHAAGVELTRTHTAAGVRARAVDMAARRAALAEALLGDVERLRASLWEEATMPIVVSEGGESGSRIVDHPLDRPLFRDQAQIARAAAMLLDRHVKLIDRDADPNLVAAKSLIETAVASVAAAFGTGDDLVSDD